MKSSTKTISIILFEIVLSLAFSSCQDKTNSPIGTIDFLHERLSNDRQVMETIEKSDFPDLVTMHLFCDSVLRNNETEKKNDYFLTLDIAKGYLQQFDFVWPEMSKDITYSQSQLTNLKADIEGQILNDSIAQVYLGQEEEAATRIHNQVLYFEDRFKNEKKELKSLKDELKKIIK